MIRRKVSREAFQKFDGERWNAFNDLCAMSELEELTEVQRVAFLAYWYDSEVQNGGHFQYFENKSDFDQLEVISSLKKINALPQSNLLARVLAAYPQKADSPQNAADYLKEENEADLTKFDLEYYSYKPEIMDLLETYLIQHENEFIEWVA